ncbi:MAG: hypothetical protein LBK06_08575 [Planctomycetaceae bacterium]|nr:hypothetical protein [Planctomycetaceae bacterium]
MAAAEVPRKITTAAQPATPFNKHETKQPNQPTAESRQLVQLAAKQFNQAAIAQLAITQVHEPTVGIAAQLRITPAQQVARLAEKPETNRQVGTTHAQQITQVGQDDLANNKVIP